MFRRYDRRVQMITWLIGHIEITKRQILADVKDSPWEPTKLAYDNGQLYALQEALHEVNSELCSP